MPTPEPPAPPPPDPPAPRDPLWQAVVAVWSERGRPERLAHLARTPGRVRLALAEHADEALARRADDDGAWAPVEVICHLRDIDDVSIERFRQMLRMPDPLLTASVMPDDLAAWGLLEDGAALIDPMAWAVDRQYLRNDAREALAAFDRRRTAMLALLDRLAPEKWSRGSVHPRFGRLTFDDWLAVLAFHDDNHVAQLETALHA